MKYCQKCGSEIPKGSLFCVVCGFKLEQPTVQPTNIQTNTTTSLTQKMSSVFAKSSVLGTVGKVFVGVSIVAATGVTVLLGIDNYSYKNKTQQKKDNQEEVLSKSNDTESKKEDLENFKEESQEQINYSFNKDNFLAFVQNQDINIQRPPVHKGTIPTVNFSVTNPCENTDDNSGLPWEDSKEVKLSTGVSAPIPKPIPDLKELSKISYNAAVSVAFEGMHLVYGPIPKKEYQKFKNVWLPLFDNPDQKVIDYLNKLNPLISQFLTLREAYMRNISDVQKVLIDVATAIRFQDQEAWETAMAEGEMYAATSIPLDNAMKNVVNKIEQLGNPPNPTELKCEKRRRYNNFFKPKNDYDIKMSMLSGYTDHSGIIIEYKEINGTQIPKKSDSFSFYTPLYYITLKLDDSEKGVLLSLELNDIAFGMFKFPVYDYVNDSDTNISSPYFESFNYPDIKDFSQLSDEQTQEGLKWIAKNKKVHPSSLRLLNFMEYYLKLGVNAKKIAPIFFQTAKEWTEEKIWNNYDLRHHDSIGCPRELQVDFMRDVMKNFNKDLPYDLNDFKDIKTPVKKDDTQQNKSIDKTESVAFHQEMVQVIEEQIRREKKDLFKVRQSLGRAQSKQERESIQRQLKDFNLRIINYQSNLQSEKDLMRSIQTGRLVHTRQIFDDYARAHFIDGIREEVVNIDATRRIASRVNRQIKLLPWQEQARARKTARNILNSKTLASGNIKKARKLTSAFNKKIQGYANYDLEKANEEIIASEENEYIAKSAIMASGAVFVGLGSAGLIEAYGAEATVAVYGPELLGGIWGGTTGTISGGPKEGIKEALSFSSPLGQASVSFFEGYQHAGYQEDATVSSKIWNGMLSAGQGYAVGKVFEMSTQTITKASLVYFGKNSKLFKPVLTPSSLRAKQLLSNKLAKVREQRARDNMHLFEKLESKFAKATGADKSALNKKLQQLAAELNLSHEAKWLLKYKASPKLRNSFDARVQTNYNEMTPKMISELKAKGYDMDNIEFIQFRNANSAGSSSMDLDYVPVIKGTKQEPGINGKIIKKDGSIVSIETFMNDAQLSMQKVYHAKHKINARLSDMQVITSAHGEAYANVEMLDPNFDFSKISAKDYKSIGDVLQVKMDGISNNKMLTKTMQLRAKCRESAKEIENMFLKKLRADLGKATTKSTKLKAQNDIDYWENMLVKFKQVGMNETDPIKIIKLNREIMRETGGRDLHGVVNDLRNTFNKL